MKREELAKLIRSFIDGSIDKWGWDDFISIPQKDDEMESIRQECAALPELYPPFKPGHYCGPEGLVRLEAIATALERHSSERA